MSSQYKKVCPAQFLLSNHRRITFASAVAWTLGYILVPVGHAFKLSTMAGISGGALWRQRNFVWINWMFLCQILVPARLQC
mmetsp:Transcript_118659/g.232985  ORF Transcript_118659/g.232985 Transcript_118659/m.232985 type:complete len:81 (+) Transcript_118659:29-271(+)